MEFREVTAIIQPGVLEKVEQGLQDIGVRGISVTKVKGFGEYADFYSRDWMVNVNRVRIEIFTEKAIVMAKVKVKARERYSGSGALGFAGVRNCGRSSRGTDLPRPHQIGRCRRGDLGEI